MNILCLLCPLIATASFFEYRNPHESTLLHELGTIDAYLFPISGVPAEVLQAASNSSDPNLVAFSTAIVDAAMYFRTHPALLSTLASRVVTTGHSAMIAAQRSAYAQVIAMVGATSHLGELLRDYEEMMTGGVHFSEFLKDALVTKLHAMLSDRQFVERYAEGLKKVEMEYERRMMDVMLEGTAGARELQTPFLMMAAAMKLVHDRAGLGDRVPGASHFGHVVNSTLAHNQVEQSLMQPHIIP